MARGRLTTLIRRAYEPVPVSDLLRTQLHDWYVDRVSASPEVNDQVLERIEAQMASARYANVLPAYSAILLDDDGHLWVENFRWFAGNDPYPDRGPTVWSVFDPDGRWLGDVETPPGVLVRHVGADRVLGFVIDELDVKEIYAFPLARDGGR